MKIHVKQMTEDEGDALWSLWDSMRSWSMDLPKDSPYRNDISEVKNFMDRDAALFDTAELLRVCRELYERNELSQEGFKVIREIVRAARDKAENKEI